MMSSAVTIMSSKPWPGENTRFVVRTAWASRDGSWRRVAIMEVLPGFHPPRIDVRLKGVVRIVFDKRVERRDRDRCVELVSKLVDQLNDPLAYEVLKRSPEKWPRGFQL